MFVDFYPPRACSPSRGLAGCADTTQRQGGSGDPAKPEPWLPDGA
jgi:hypothetical protein